MNELPPLKRRQQTGRRITWTIIRTMILIGLISTVAWLLINPLQKDVDIREITSQNDQLKQNIDSLKQEFVKNKNDIQIQLADFQSATENSNKKTIEMIEIISNTIQVIANKIQEENETLRTIKLEQQENETKTQNEIQRIKQENQKIATDNQTTSQLYTVAMYRISLIATLLNSNSTELLNGGKNVVFIDKDWTINTTPSHVKDMSRLERFTKGYKAKPGELR